MIDDDDDESEFQYPTSPNETMRAPSLRSYATDYFSRPGASRTPTDLTPHLAQAPDFRVPTHEAPQKVITPSYQPPTPHEVHARWERDDHVSECRQCQRRFNFILRRVRVQKCTNTLLHTDRDVCPFLARKLTFACYISASLLNLSSALSALRTHLLRPMLVL